MEVLRYTCEQNAEKVFHKALLHMAEYRTFPSIHYYKRQEGKVLYFIAALLYIALLFLHLKVYAKP